MMMISKLFLLMATVAHAQSSFLPSFSSSSSSSSNIGYSSPQFRRSAIAAGDEARDNDGRKAREWADSDAAIADTDANAVVIPLTASSSSSAHRPLGWSDARSLEEDDEDDDDEDSDDEDDDD